MPTKNTNNTSSNNTNDNTDNQQKPPLPRHNLTSKMSEIFELINTEKNTN